METRELLKVSVYAIANQPKGLLVEIPNNFRTEFMNIPEQDQKDFIQDVTSAVVSAFLNIHKDTSIGFADETMN